DLAVGLLETGRRQVDARGERAQFLDHRIAMGEVGGRGLGDAVDLRADPGKTVLDAGNDALNLVGAFAGVLGARRSLAALLDEIADLAVQAANGVADLMGRLAGCLRKV